MLNEILPDLPEGSDERASLLKPLPSQASMKIVNMAKEIITHIGQSYHELSNVHSKEIALRRCSLHKRNATNQKRFAITVEVPPKLRAALF